MIRIRKILKIYILGLFLLGANFVFAESEHIENLIDPITLNQLKKEGMLRNIYSDKDVELKLIPKTDYKQTCLDKKVEKKKKDFPFISESLYYFPKSQLSGVLNSEKLTVETVSKILRSFSKMKGMTYYSKNRNKTEVLYKDAYTIDGVKSRKKIDDDLTGSANGKTLYCLQNDSSFGKCVYELKFYQNSNTVYAIFENKDSIGWGPVRAVEPGNLRIHVMVTDCGDSYCLFLLSDANCGKFPGMQERMENSLTSRIDALKDWFLKQF